MYEKKKKNYLNNRDLLAQYHASLEQGKMTEELAKMLMVLVKRIGSKGNFCGYTFKEDMESYSLLVLCSSWKKFNHEKYDNIFAYYTSCVFNAFKQYLNKEKKTREVRDALLHFSGLDPSWSFTGDSSGNHSEE